MAGSKTSQLSLKQPVLIHTTYTQHAPNYVVTISSLLLDQKCTQGFGRKPERNTPLGRLSTDEMITFMDLMEIQQEGMNWIHLAQDEDEWWAPSEHGTGPSDFVKCREFLD